MDYKALLRGWIMENVEYGNKWNIAQHLARVALYELKGLDALHPQVRDKARELVQKCAAENIHILISSNPFRTVKRQQELYDQGRITEGPIVTNAKPLESYHCVALAFDVVFEGVPYPPQSDPRWQRVGNIGESIGLTWGNSWGDKPHFQYDLNGIMDIHDIKKYFEISR